MMDVALQFPLVGAFRVGRGPGPDVLAASPVPSTPTTRVLVADAEPSRNGTPLAGKEGSEIAHAGHRVRILSGMR